MTRNGLEHKMLGKPYKWKEASLWEPQIQELPPFSPSKEGKEKLSGNKRRYKLVGNGLK